MFGFWILILSPIIIVVLGSLLINFLKKKTGAKEEDLDLLVEDKSKKIIKFLYFVLYIFSIKFDNGIKSTMIIIAVIILSTIDFFISMRLLKKYNFDSKTRKYIIAESIVMPLWVIVLVVIILLL
ncbi:hypothetical protein [Romboutsia sp. MSSM.1001216sp_RTP31141st1_G3_RTP31141_220114]|uniref:hypothetical protein n=1 Tax=unclassified Romboutsia TaxID=2626894 RepID=UPI0031B6030B